MDRQIKIKGILSAIYDVHKLIQSESETSTDAYKHLRISLQSVFKFDLFSVFQFDYLEQRLHLSFGYGDPYNLLDAVNFRLGKGATKWVAVKKRSLLIKNAERESNSSKKLVNSYLAVPIIFSGYLLGVVVVGSFEPERFGSEDKFLLEILSDYLGNLIIRNQWLPEKAMEAVQT